nr:transketolase C-terminal domain-containing protein [Candidatus Njordarchaeum guaymaensis]
MDKVREITFQAAIREGIAQEMEADPSIFVIGEDMRRWGGGWGVTEGLVNKFGPERVIDTPISEAGFIGSSVGTALIGRKPIVELMFIDFFGVAMDQIYNQLAKIRYMTGGQARVPVIIRTGIGAGQSAAAHHSGSVYSIFAHIPGMKIVVPSTPYDAKGLMISAIRNDDPVLYCEHAQLYQTKGHVPDREYTIPIGQADVKREGNDVTIVALAWMARLAQDAAEELAKEKVDVEIIDPRTIVPLDKKTILESVRKTGRLLVVDED